MPNGRMRADEITARLRTSIERASETRRAVDRLRRVRIGGEVDVTPAIGPLGQQPPAFVGQAPRSDTTGG